MENSQQQEGKRKLKTKIINHLTVRKDNTVYFNDYLQQYVGARWQQVKGSLYDAGYTTAEVNRYRDKQVEEFQAICRKNNLRGII